MQKVVALSVAALLAASMSAEASNPCDKEGRGDRKGTHARILARDNDSDQAWKYVEGWSEAAGKTKDKDKSQFDLKNKYDEVWEAKLSDSEKDVLVVAVFEGASKITCTAKFSVGDGLGEFLSAGCKDENNKDYDGVACSRDYGSGKKRFNIHYSFD